MDELAYYLSLTTNRMGKISVEKVKDAELLASLAINDISRHVLTGLGYSEHLESEILFFSLLSLHCWKEISRSLRLIFAGMFFRSHPSHGIPDGHRI